MSNPRNERRTGRDNSKSQSDERKELIILNKDLNNKIVIN